MVLSDKAQFPGLIVKGKEYPHPDRKTAGMLFFNAEGTENPTTKSIRINTVTPVITVN